MATEPVALTDGYLLLANGRVHRDSEGPPTGLYVRGKTLPTRKQGLYRFEAVGDILGDGDLGGGGQPGWMELHDGFFHPVQETRSPFPPYVQGHIWSCLTLNIDVDAFCNAYADAHPGMSVLHACFR